MMIMQTKREFTIVISVEYVELGAVNLNFTAINVDVAMALK
jgi:hypothetical protein